MLRAPFYLMLSALRANRAEIQLARHQRVEAEMLAVETNAEFAARIGAKRHHAN